METAREAAETAREAAETERLRKDAILLKRKETRLRNKRIKDEKQEKARSDALKAVGKAETKTEAKGSVNALLSQQREKDHQLTTARLKKELELSRKRLKDNEAVTEDLRGKLEQVVSNPSCTVTKSRASYKISLGPTILSQPVSAKLPKTKTSAGTGMSSALFRCSAAWGLICFVVFHVLVEGASDASSKIQHKNDAAAAAEEGSIKSALEASDAKSLSPALGPASTLVEGVSVDIVKAMQATIDDLKTAIGDMRNIRPSAGASNQAASTPLLNELPIRLPAVVTDRRDRYDGYQQHGDGNRSGFSSYSTEWGGNHGFEQKGRYPSPQFKRGEFFGTENSMPRSNQTDDHQRTRQRDENQNTRDRDENQYTRGRDENQNRRDHDENQYTRGRNDSQYTRGRDENQWKRGRDDEQYNQHGQQKCDDRHTRDSRY